jgi:hypothetical protein
MTYVIRAVASRVGAGEQMSSRHHWKTRFFIFHAYIGLKIPKSGDLPPNQPSPDQNPGYGPDNIKQLRRNTLLGTLHVKRLDAVQIQIFRENVQDTVPKPFKECGYLRKLYKIYHNHPPKCFFPLQSLYHQNLLLIKGNILLEQV